MGTQNQNIGEHTALILLAMAKVAPVRVALLFLVLWMVFLDEADGSHVYCRSGMHGAASVCEEGVNCLSVCDYGSYRDLFGNTVCKKGPSQVCGGKDHIYGRCGEGMMCSNCNRCQGCSLKTSSAGVTRIVFYFEQ